MRIIMGIDPPKGISICKHDGSYRLILETITVKGLPEMLQKIRELHQEYHGKIDLVRIEKSNSKYVYQRPGASPAAMRNISHRVGENSAKADAIFEFCKALGLQAELRPPIKGYTKLSADQVWRLTGYEGKTSEHARDAVMLSWL